MSVIPRFLPQVALMGILAACGGDAEEWPPFVEALIAQMEAGPVGNPPASIWQYAYKGQEVYYVPPVCCDVPSTLYDRAGSVLCSPDGGLTGRGDGRCPDFFALRTGERRIWVDGRRGG